MPCTSLKDLRSTWEEDLVYTRNPPTSDRDEDIRREPFCGSSTDPAGEVPSSIRECASASSHRTWDRIARIHVNIPQRPTNMISRRGSRHLLSGCREDPPSIVDLRNAIPLPIARPRTPWAMGRGISYAKQQRRSSRHNHHFPDGKASHM
jgi:hypothetical protein